MIRFLVFLLLFASPLAAQWGGSGRFGPEIRLWADGGHAAYRGGEWADLAFETSDDAYVAVVQLSADGELDFLYPRSPWDDGFVRGGWDIRLGSPATNRWSVGRENGVGYVYAIASEYPLDFGAFRGRGGGSWSWNRYGRQVRGDPYYVLDRIAELLVPGGARSGYGDDLYVYRVGSRRSHFYPRYACYDGIRGSGRWQAWGAPYYRCDRLRALLLNRPGYYYAPPRVRGYYLDGRYGSGVRFGDRRYGDEPRYRYKEPGVARGTPADQPPERTRPAVAAPVPVPKSRRSEPVERTERQRPVLQRRPEPAPRAEPRPEPRREAPRTAPRVQEPRRAEPRTEPARAPRAEPRSSRPQAPRVGRPQG